MRDHNIHPVGATGGLGGDEVAGERGSIDMPARDATAGGVAEEAVAAAEVRTDIAPRTIGTDIHPRTVKEGVRQQKGGALGSEVSVRG